MLIKIHSLIVFLLKEKKGHEREKGLYGTNLQRSEYGRTLKL